MSRRWLVAVSIAAHLCILTGVAVTGVWRLERMDGGRARVSLTQPFQMPAPSGGPVAARRPETPPTQARVVARTPRQPTPRAQIVRVTASPESHDPDTGTGPGPGTPVDTGQCLENCGPAPQADPVCGNGAVEVGEQCDDGNALDGDGCSATCRIEIPPPPPRMATVAPGVLQGLRISGETQVQPSTITQNQMMRDGASRVDGIVVLCISIDGSVASSRMLASTRYPAYDAVLLAAVRDWRYQPYQIGGRAVPACSTVRFVYSMR